MPEPSELSSSITQLVKAVLSSPKYQAISPSLVYRIGEKELQKNPKLKLAIKETKNKLHQVASAYFKANINYQAWLTRLLRIDKFKNEQEFLYTLRLILSLHASTSERLPILERFYQEIFAKLPPVESILDIACGLNPLSIPWMPVSPSQKYLAWDIYADLVSFLNQVLLLFDCEGRAEVVDVLSINSTPEVDVALILKTLPCLEHIEKSITLKLLESICARFLVVSFPVHSLCGNQKGMQAFYAAQFSQLASSKDWHVQSLEFPSELVYIIEK